jgi:hypothetical protein
MLEVLLVTVLLLVVAPAIILGIAWFAKTFIGRRDDK